MITFSKNFNHGGVAREQKKHFQTTLVIMHNILKLYIILVQMQDTTRKTNFDV